jgi:hypothetical protein
MDAETLNGCAHGGTLIVERIVTALADKPAGTKYETFARKGLGTEKEDLSSLLRKSIMLSKGYAVHEIRVSGNGQSAIIVGVKL